MITLIIVILTSFISILAFQNKKLFYKLAFNAYQTYYQKKWYQLFSYSLVHANFLHLFINMYVLYFFGIAVEEFFNIYFGVSSALIYLFFYVSAVIFSILGDLQNNKDNPYYLAVGASGAVSAVVYAYILFEPLRIFKLFFAIPMPAIVFGVLYLIYSYIMAKKQIDNIGHRAHFLGAIYGFLFPIFLKPSIFVDFILKFF